MNCFQKFVLKIPAAKDVLNILVETDKDCNHSDLWSRSTDRLWLDLPNWSKKRNPEWYCKYGVFWLKCAGFANVKQLSQLRRFEDFVSITNLGREVGKQS